MHFVSGVDMPDFMLELRQQKGVAARALEFTILTATRTSEALRAAWPEIDFKARLWVIPARNTVCPSAGQR